MTIDLALVNCRAVMPTGAILNADIWTTAGRISGIVAPGTRTMARERYDVHGAVVLPGIIDTHFHVGFHAGVADFETETRSAAVGGVTTTCVFVRGLDDYGELIPAHIGAGEDRAYVDFAVHLGVLTEAQLSAVGDWAQRYGIRSFKMYTCYRSAEGEQLRIRGQDDGFLLEGLTRIASIPGAMALVHCENQEIVERAITQTRALAGVQLTDLELWDRSRPVVAEVEAIRRVCYLAGRAGAELLIPHVSSADALAAIEEARGRGQAVHAETCPHYLALDSADAIGVLGKINPPIRGQGHAAALWAGIRTGSIEVVGTDHGAVLRARKAGQSVWDASPGFPGVATLLPVLMTEGVAEGRLPLGTVARLQANAARILGLERKGQIAVGFDADLIVVDPGHRQAVSAERLQSAADFSVFEGRSLVGFPQMTILRGRVVARDGEVVGCPGAGSYIARTGSGHPQP